MVQAIETVFVYWIVEYKSTMNERLRERENSQKLQQDKDAFANVEDGMRNAMDDGYGGENTAKYMVDSIEGENFEEDDYTEPPSILNQIRRRQSVDDTHYPEPHIQQDHDDSRPKDSDRPKEKGMKSVARSLTRSTSMSSKTILSAFSKMTKHRKEFLRQKSEYKLALTIDAIFLTISGLAFVISSILFFALE